MQVDQGMHGLAGLARRALAAAWEPTLLVTEPCEDPHGPRAFLQDRDGRPVFTCPATSPMLACVGQAALLTFEVPEHIAGCMTIVLGGSLRDVREDHRCPRHPDVRVLALDVVQVVVEQRDPAHGEPTRREVPLDAYRAAGPDDLTRHATRVIEHTNGHHARELRESVAGLIGIPASDVATARLISLDRHGARVTWVDTDGSHTAELAFDEPASGPSALGRMLRAHLR